LNSWTCVNVPGYEQGEKSGKVRACVAASLELKRLLHQARESFQYLHYSLQFEMAGEYWERLLQSGWSSKRVAEVNAVVTLLTNARRVTPGMRRLDFGLLCWSTTLEFKLL
jgi:hypothetical protein